eukprot:1147010-Pelagomonas_calceolata.AAC.3
MNGLHHAHHFQQKICSADPLDLSQLNVGLRSRHLAYWRQFSGYDPQGTNSKKIAYHHWCALPSKPAPVTYSPDILPKYFYLDLPKYILRSVAPFRLRVHTLKAKQATWVDTVSPTCDLCDAQDDVQNEQLVVLVVENVILKCTHLHVCSLRLKNASLFSGPLLSLSHSSNSMAPCVPGIHHVPYLHRVHVTILSYLIFLKSKQ